MFEDTVRQAARDGEEPNCHAWNRRGLAYSADVTVDAAADLGRGVAQQLSRSCAADLMVRKLFEGAM